MFKIIFITIRTHYSAFFPAAYNTNDKNHSINQMKLEWSDEFEKDRCPDSSNWTYETGFVRNKEEQWDQLNNAYYENGFLIIEARRKRVKNPEFDHMNDDWRINREYTDYTSASLTTRGLHSWKFGRFEMYCKLETDVGLLPAFWALGIKGR